MIKRKRLFLFIFYDIIFMVIVLKNNFKKFYKENKWLLITFFVSLLVVSIIYTLKHIAPFGNNSMLDVDFYHQYGPLLNELYDRVKAGENLLYSFNTGGGIPFYRNFLNYLSSPFNIIMFLFKKEDIVMSFSIIIGLKAVFASCTMAYYLKNTFKKDNFLICIFGLLYAFSGYFCAYYWNIMWLDGMVFLPLIMYGINKIVDDKKPLFYTIFLAIMLFANYFIGYMICIFSVFYFLGYFFYRGNFKIKNILTKFLMFALFSFLAAGLVSFALLPLFYSLNSISATKGSFPDAATNFGLLDYLFNHITGTNRTVFASDTLPLPNVYSGVITICLIFVFFINNKINIKAKLISISTILFFFFSFNINTLDFIWHAFHVPNDLPWRYSFIYVFVLITIAYYSLINIKNVSKLKTSICFMITFVFIMLASKLSFKNLSDDRIIICLIILTGYYLIYLISYIKKIPKKLIAILLISLVSFECIWSINYNWDINHDITTFMSDKTPYQDLIKKSYESDNDLYRTEKIDYLTLNDGAWYDYKGISTFSSMAYESVAKFQRMIGMAGNDINSYYYKNCNSPIYNTMFNIKYLMGNYLDDDYYKLVYSNDYYNLNEYKYPSSLVYMVNENIKNWELISYNPFLNQQNFVSLSTLNDNVFKPLSVSSISGGLIIDESFLKNSNGEFNYVLENGSNTITFSLKNLNEESIYLYIGGNNVSSFEVDGSYYGITSDEYYIVNVGKKLPGMIDIKINFNDSNDGNLKFYAYTINDATFKEFYDNIKSGSLIIEKYSDSLIIGKITAKENQTAFTTIAYDKGWSVYVDGKKVETYKIADAYLGFDVPSGTHEIKLSFYPVKLKEGLIISIGSLITLFAYFVFTDPVKYKNKEKR